MIKEGFTAKATFEPTREHGQNLNRRHEMKRIPSGKMDEQRDREENGRDGLESDR